ncbi:hypothetical protein [Pontiella sulfatireligans]|uniref:hypothetical protein n=1 Tax=Pontiella sulfatireligans TaxID=2750658 RepID=UPI00109CA0A9|nr:hypothetical protein [Pontiella sulfatireligans]
MKTTKKTGCSGDVPLAPQGSRWAAVPERDTLKTRARGAPVPGRGPRARTASLRDGRAMAGWAGDAVGEGDSRNHATTAAPPDRHSVG